MWRLSVCWFPASLPLSTAKNPVLPSLWQSQQVSPLTQIILFPGVPALFALLGMALGWRIFRRRWSPRIVEEE